MSFNSNVVFNELITFDKLKYCQIPVKTRLSFEIVLIFKENSKMTIGCVSMNLFNEKGIFNSGVRDLNVWPFYAIDERLGCMANHMHSLCTLDAGCPASVPGFLGFNW